MEATTKQRVHGDCGGKTNLEIRPFLFITVRNEVAKVMFLHLSVSHSVPGGSASVLAGIPHTPPPEQAPPSGRLLLRTVRILLECILV